MTTETLRWMYELHDKMSGPASNIHKQLNGIAKSLQSMPAYIAVAERALGALVGAFERVASVTIGGALDFGEFAVKALSFKESSLVAFETMLGTKKEAREFFDLAKSYGKLTPFETSDVIDSMQNLMQAGFTRKEVPVLFQAFGDVSASRGFSKEVLKDLSRAAGQIRGMGRLMGGELLQLGNAGVGRADLFKHIAKKMGIDPKRVQAEMEAGRISAELALDAMLNSIKERYSGGKALGSAMLAQATTIRGLMSTLSSAPMDLFLDIDLEKSAGFKGLKSFMVNLVEALNPDSLNGNKLKSLLEGILNDVGGWLAQMSPEKMAQGFEKFVWVVKTGVEGLGEFVTSFAKVVGPALGFTANLVGQDAKAKQFRETMAGLGGALGTVAGAFVALAGAISKAFDAWFDLKSTWQHPLESQYDKSRGLGANLMKAVGMGIIDSTPVGSMAKAAGVLQAVFADAQEIHSPSRVFRRFGQYTAEGYGLGIEDGTPEASESVRRLGAGRPAVGHAVGGGPVSIALTINVDGGKDSADTIARRLADLLPSQLASLFEQLAVEGGAA